MTYFEYIAFLLSASFVAGILTTIAAIVAAHYRAHRLFRNQRAPRIIVEQLDPDVAREVASSRRKFIEAQLIAANTDADTSYVISEIPPGSFSEPLTISRLEASAQRVGLRWQLKDDPFLLQGRVMDALQSISRREKIEPERLATSVKLVNRRNGNTFLVVIESLAGDFLAKEFARLGSWLGISVAVQDPIGAIYYGVGICRPPSSKPPAGKSGWVGGGVAVGHTDLLVTCAHVVSTDCGSIFFKPELKAETYAPDAVILYPGSPCFSRSGAQTPVTPLSGDAATLLKGNTLFWISARSRKGRIYSIVTWATYSGRTHYFPHVEIESDTNHLMDLIYWPPGSNDFSVEGDSGSWVVTSNERWLGMLVAGCPRHHISHVALAEPLVDYFATCYTAETGRTAAFAQPYMEL